MSIRLQRFDFGSLRDFRGPMVVEVTEELLVEEELPPPPPPPTFSEEELELAKQTAQKLGYAEGFEAGLARAAEQADVKRQAVDATVTRLGHLLGDLQHRYQHLLESEASELSQLVLMIARKIAGEAIKASAEEAIGTLVRQCLPVIFSKPKLAIEMHPEGFETIMDYLEKQLQASGYEGEIQFRANPNLGTNDVVLDWGSGQAARNVAAMWQEIEGLLAAMPVAVTLPETTETQSTPGPQAPTV